MLKPYDPEEDKRIKFLMEQLAKVQKKEEQIKKELRVLIYKTEAL